MYPQPTARSSGYEGELSVKPVSEWCDGSGAAPRPLKGGALGAGGESDTNEKPRHSAQPKRLRGAVAGPFAVMAGARSHSVWCGEGCCGSRRAPALAWTGCMLCARSGGERINYSRTRGRDNVGAHYYAVRADARLRLTLISSGFVPNTSSHACGINTSMIAGLPKRSTIMHLPLPPGNDAIAES